jgi:hypothetical protein
MKKDNTAIVKTKFFLDLRQKGIPFEKNIPNFLNKKLRKLQVPITIGNLPPLEGCQQDGVVSKHPRVLLQCYQRRSESQRLFFGAE